MGHREHAPEKTRMLNSGGGDNVARYRASIEGLADKIDNLPLSEPQEARRDGRWCFFSPFQRPANRVNSDNGGKREERQNEGGKGGGKKRRGRKNVARVRKMGRKHRLQGLVTPRYEQRDQAER
ncbi:hypothetical protein ALC53_10413 [Atta colombica]|uniref:Uncharacterized protein n=1 Tax=Atta colombica TaxID=520822 RepID=A0A195B4Q3_9HYME|nr:hypothetical protein ALC53_10413 [Atta colombica]